MRSDELFESGVNPGQDSLAETVGSVLARVLDRSTGSEAPSAVAGNPVRVRANRVPAPGGRQGRPTSPHDQELAACLRRAEEGDPASARRVAELLELKDRQDDALDWWRRAAEAGDLDAILYYREKTTG
jgi:hypothetical protein